MTGWAYLAGALLLGIGLLYFGVRLTGPKMPVASAASKLRARHLLQATVIYLPILFVIMMTDVKR
jgi:heme O synthase-like polyprenyltransferase